MAFDSFGSVDDGSITHPNTPAGLDILDDDESLHHGDFARLTPLNAAAKLAFHQIYVAMQDEKVSAEESRFQWHRKFLYHRPQPEPLDERETSHSGVSDLDSSGIHEQNREEDLGLPLVRLGFWRFNMELPPHNWQLGWRLGKGRHNQSRGGVDILLTSNQLEPKIHGWHMRIGHELNSGRLMIYPSHRIKVNARQIERGDNILLGGGDTIITIGPFDYVFRYLDIDPTFYKHQINKLAKTRSVERDFASTYIALTPQATEFKLPGALNEYTVCSSFATGSSCQMHTGMDRKGACYALKRMTSRLSPVDREHPICLEVETMKSLQGHSSISRFIEVIKIDPSTRDGLYESYIVTQPLGTSLRQLLLTETSDQTRIGLLMQILDGVGFIHSHKCMHRDLKLENIIATTTMSGMKAYIIDFGASTWDEESFDHCTGTIRYLAPEVLALKYPQPGTRKRPYTRAADIWTLGQTFYEFICRHRLSHEYMTPDIHAQILSKKHWRKENDQQDVELLFQLIFRMMTWEAKVRITAAEGMDLATEINLSRLLPPTSKGNKRERDDSPVE